MIVSDFAQLLELLIDNDIKFIVAGGVACALNGYIRATEDVDIIVDASSRNIERLLSTLGHWGEGYAKNLDITDFGIEPGAIRIVEDFPLDIFTLLSEKTYDDYIESARCNSQGIHYLSPQDIIFTKKRSQREKDQLDILAMRRIKAEAKK